MKKRDHLPFSNCIFQIAQSLPNAPQKPKLMIVLTYEFFFNIILSLSINLIVCSENILIIISMISKELIKKYYIACENNRSMKKKVLKFKKTIKNKFGIYYFLI